jgi:hypothetical protein
MNTRIDPMDSQTHVSTRINHHASDNTHHIDFLVDGDFSRLYKSPPNPSLALRVYSTVLSHIAHYIKNNPNAKEFTYGAGDDKKARIYNKLAKKFKIELIPR